ncbi:MAG: glutamate dehydrogenase oxidoreductase protein [Candidatus Parcubacteria bacterium]|jgi:glutamate dehydrogenase (NADP+)
METPFEQALKQLERANAVRTIPVGLRERLAKPMREVRANLAVRMDDGSTRFFEAYRVQHNNLRGPFKGGIRFHSQTDIEEVRALAFWMTLKCTVAGIPMGGGKGGITVDPKALSAGERERLSRAFVRAFADVLGPQKDVPAPDVNTTAEIMDWMTDEFQNATGDTTRATFTGKSLANGGSEGRGTATAQGGFFVFEALRATLNLPASCTVAIQGFGNAGTHAAEIWRAAGHRIVAVSDSKGTIFMAEGLDPAAVETHKRATGSVANFPGATTLPAEAILATECDLLIPAALEGQFRADNVAAVRARAILELANGPTTPEADDALFARGIPVVPDILANAGGVTVSTFEWEQNLKGEHWAEADVFARLQKTMNDAATAIAALAQTHHTDLRRAAFTLALQRLEEALEKS